MRSLGDLEIQEILEILEIPGRSGQQNKATQETTAMLFAYTNATLLLKWSKERSDDRYCPCK